MTRYIVSKSLIDNFRQVISRLFVEKQNIFSALEIMQLDNDLKSLVIYPMGGDKKAIKSEKEENKTKKNNTTPDKKVKKI